MGDRMEYAVEPEDQPGFQPGGQAWDPDRPDILELLQIADQSQVYPIYQGSNHTFLTVLDAGEAGKSLAVYKPARGEYPLYDFPSGTLYKREIGAWLVDRILGWHLVPPTVESGGKYGSGPNSPEDGQINTRRGGRGFYFRDLDGHLLEVMTRPSG